MTPFELEEPQEIIEAKIKSFCETVWKDKVEGPDTIKWLNNFTKKDEKLNALYLLSKFMYFGSTEIKEMLKSMYRDFIKYPLVQKIRKNNNNTTDLSIINSEFESEIASTRFMALGNPSESSAHLLYYFRQENDLYRNLFVDLNSILKINGDKIELEPSSLRRIILIDDFSGGGTQALRYSKNFLERIKLINPKIELHYLSLFLTSKAKENLEGSNFTHVNSVFLLDESFKCFEDSSRYFKEEYENISKLKAKNLCLRYADKLIPDPKRQEQTNPLGYNSCQLLLSMFHNTPNNTLPIFWFNEKHSNWFPVFKRYPKNYGVKK